MQILLKYLMKSSDPKRFKANEEVREETDLVFEKRVTTGNLFDLLKAGKGKASSFTGIQNMLQSKNMYVGGFEAS